MGLSHNVTGPLDGFRVLDASTILAGPLCCQILGDYGADVIKIEHPVLGDSMRGHGLAKDDIPLWWKEISRNKRTVAINFSKPEGAQLLRSLAEHADVLVENFRPGTFERWGLSPEALWEINPDLIIVRITGFGQQGPYSQRAGFGTLAEAMSGFAHLTGEASGPPTLPAFGLADSICGIAASSAVAMALLARSTGKARGQIIDMDLLSPIMTSVGPHVTNYDQLKVIDNRHGNRSENNAPRNTYQTKDGKWVAVSSSAQRIAERVITLVGHEHLMDEPWFATGRGRAEHVEIVDEAVGSWISARTLAEVLAAFEETGAAIAPIYDAADILADPHITQTQIITAVPDEDLGEIKMHNVMWRMSGTPGQIRHTGRKIGENTTEILADLGLTASDIQTLKDQEIIR